MKYTQSILSGLFFVFVFSVSLAYGQLGVGIDAPDFTLKDLDNKDVSLTDFRNKVVLLFFLGNNCPFCKAEAPSVESKIWRAYQEKGVGVLGIDQWNGSGPTIKTFFKEPTGVTFPLLQNGSATAAAYKVTYDWFILLDQQHKVYFTLKGSLYSSSTPDAIVSSVIKKIDELLMVSDVEEIEDKTIPENFELAQNYPNPFNPSTTITYSVSEPSQVELSIYNVRGALVKQLINGNSSPGEFRITWDSRNQSNMETGAGIYFYRLQIKSSRGKVFTQTRKMILIK